MVSKHVKTEKKVVDIKKTGFVEIENKLKSQEVILENETYLVTNENISRVKPLTKYKDLWLWQLEKN